MTGMVLAVIAVNLIIYSHYIYLEQSELYFWKDPSTGKVRSLCLKSVGLDARELDGVCPTDPCHTYYNSHTDIDSQTLHAQFAVSEST